MRQRLSFLWTAAADLAVDGILGVAWFTLLITLLSVGVGAVPAFGIGVLLLWGTAFVARGVRHIERSRAAAIYGVEIVPPRRPQARSAGFAGWLGQIVLELGDSALWKGLAHHLVTLVLGTAFWVLLLAPLQALTRSILVGDALLVAAAVLGLVLLVLFTYGAGLLDRRLAVVLLGAGRTAALEQRVDSLEGARQGAVDAAAGERLRIERDLHDGVQPRLVNVAMTLGLAKAKFATDPEAAKALLDEAHQQTKDSITELRQLARGIHPAVLTDRGLDAALSAVAAHCAVPATVRVELPERPSPEIEAVLYFVVAEALTNVSKHSGASGCSVSVTRSPTGVRAVVFDNGAGGAHAEPGGGLAGMADRVRSAGGTLDIDSRPGGPTVLTVEVPCAF